MISKLPSAGGKGYIKDRGTCFGIGDQAAPKDAFILNGITATHWLQVHGQHGKRTSQSAEVVAEPTSFSASDPIEVIF